MKPASTNSTLPLPALKSELTGEIVGVRLIDHLILGGWRWVSLTRLKSWRHDDESVDTATHYATPPA